MQWGIPFLKMRRCLGRETTKKPLYLGEIKVLPFFCSCTHFSELGLLPQLDANTIVKCDNN